MKNIALMLVLAALALPVFCQQAQPAPQTFLMAGIGFDSTAAPKTTGWAGGGRLINDPTSPLPTYGVLEFTPRTGGVTTAIGSVYMRVYSSKSFWVAMNGGAGYASFLDAVGSAFQAGGAIGYRLPRNPRVSLVFKPGAIKLNVGTNATPGKLDVAPEFKFGVLWAL